MKNIGIDIDGVLADFNKALAIELGHSPVHQHPDRWDWPQFVAGPGIIDRVWTDITNRAEWWFDHIKPYAEVTTSTVRAQLMKWNNEENLYFITARPQTPEMKLYTELWLKVQFKLANPTVILAKDKGDVATGIGLTHFVDDNMDNVDRVADATGGLCLTAILHRPYNHDTTHPHVKRIHTFSDFISLVNLSPHAVADRRPHGRLC